jgi:lysozyme
MNLALQLEREEDRVPYAYQDSKGYWTIGVGRLVDKRKGGRLHDSEIDLLLANDIREKTAQVVEALDWAARLDEPRMAVLVGMCFQMGIGSAETGKGLLGFRLTLPAIRDGHYSHAAALMLESKWAKVDSPARARRMARQIETGAWQ